MKGEMGVGAKMNTNNFFENLLEVSYTKLYKDSRAIMLVYASTLNPKA